MKRMPKWTVHSNYFHFQNSWGICPAGHEQCKWSNQAGIENRARQVKVWHIFVTQTTQLAIKFCPAWSRESCGKTEEQSPSNCNQFIGKTQSGCLENGSVEKWNKWAQAETGEVLTVYKPKHLYHSGNPEVRCITPNGSAVSFLRGFQDQQHKALTNWSHFIAHALRSRLG